MYHVTLSFTCRTLNMVPWSLSRQKLQGLANDGWNLIYMMSFFVMLFGVVFRFIVSNQSEFKENPMNQSEDRYFFRHILSLMKSWKKHIMEVIVGLYQKLKSVLQWLSVLRIVFHSSHFPTDQSFKLKFIAINKNSEWKRNESSILIHNLQLVVAHSSWTCLWNGLTFVTVCHFS